MGLHQVPALITFLCAMVIKRLTDQVRQESVWTMLFADLFQYLGSTVQSNKEGGKEVKKRVQAGWSG